MRPNAVSDEERDVTRARDGDPEAFERLYRCSVARVFGLACRLAGEEHAEDLTQEVFVRAWEKLPTFQGRSRFGTWLHRLAVNHILGRREQLARRRRHDGGAVDGDRTPGRRVSVGLAIDLERAIDTLPQGARQVFVLYDVEGWTHEEIAGQMSISVGTSKSQLHRARMMLREWLGGRA
ncbi:MAG: RNA polymerase sigma factor [Gemmatimonadota bacterium]|nr:RNA polymerase sigma factor [Gemmatimonadota bacterium]